MKRSHHLPQAPHWHREHQGELRWPVSAVVLVVIVLQLLLPHALSLKSQPLICAVEAGLLLTLIAMSPKRIHIHTAQRWWLGIALNLVMSLSNVASVVLLIRQLIHGGITDAASLLASGGSIWLTNVVVFGLWYWELDREGPGARAEARDPYPDFIFPQMSDPSYAPEDWHPTFFDYLYTSFTNASAFSPTDVMPLTRLAKLLMLIQSTTSLLTVGLVIARAVNILK